MAKREVATEDGESGLAEGFGEGDEERRLAVGAGAVREDEAGFRERGWAVEEAADGRIGLRVTEGGGGGRVGHWEAF